MSRTAPLSLPTHPASRELLLGAGFSPQAIRSHLEAGRLVRVRRGVYVAASAWPDDPAAQHVMRARAELVLYESGVISHQSAALVWGLPHPGFQQWYELEPCISLPAGGTLRTRVGGIPHRVALLPGGHVTRDEAGYAVTTIARTAVDLAVGRDLPDSLVVLDVAARRLVESMVVSARRSDYANPRLIDASRAVLLDAARARRSAALAGRIAFADPRRESPAESLSAGWFELAGLPRPLLQHPIRTAAGVFFVDFYWEEQRVVGECDGAMKYDDRERLVAEKVREDSLREVGHGVVRWLGRDLLRDPWGTVGRVARTLDR